MRTKILLTFAGICLLGWVLFFQAPTLASASPHMGITLTPTRFVPPVTLTPTICYPCLTKTAVPPTLPPPEQKTPVVIPVTGENDLPDLSGAVNVGLVCVALGLIFLGILWRSKK